MTDAGTVIADQRSLLAGVRINPTDRVLLILEPDEVELAVKTGQDPARVLLREPLRHKGDTGDSLSFIAVDRQKGNCRRALANHFTAAVIDITDRKAEIHDSRADLVGRDHVQFVGA